VAELQSEVQAMSLSHLGIEIGALATRLIGRSLAACIQTIGAEVPAVRKSARLSVAADESTFWYVCGHVYA
jgi:hypothetical protein